MVKDKDFHWLAGLLEGDGSFYYQDKGSPAIKLSMTDRDVVEKAARIMGASVLGPYIDKREENRKPMWVANLSGQKALDMMSFLLPHMGKRRSARIESIQLACQHRVGRGNHPRNHGVEHPNHKLNPVAVRVIRFLSDRGMSRARLANAYRVNQATIGHVANRYSWKHVEEINVS